MYGFSLQGKLTSLHEGEDFGQLALINKMSQDTSVVIRKHDCHFLRVGNLDFVSILKVRFPRGKGSEL